MGVLPTSVTKKRDDLMVQTVLIYGATKMGKTTFCSQIPGVLFAATEPGLNHLEVAQCDIKTWGEFVAMSNALATEKHNYRAVCIDTANNLYLLACQEICNQKGVEYIGDFTSSGKGWAMAANMLYSELLKLKNMGLGVWLIAHSEERTIKSKLNGEITRIRPAISGKAGDSIIALADIVAYVDIAQKKVKDENGKDTGDTIPVNVLRLRPTEHYEAGDRSGYLPPVVELNYQAFSKAYESGKQKAHEAQKGGKA